MGDKVGENPAALRSAIFLLFAKNRSGGVQTAAPSRAKVKLWAGPLPTSAVLGGRVWSSYVTARRPLVGLGASRSAVPAVGTKLSTAPSGAAAVWPDRQG